MSEQDIPPSAIARALADGVDISLLKKNLRMTPSERVQQAQDALAFVVALQKEVKQWRASQKRNE